MDKTNNLSERVELHEYVTTCQELETKINELKISIETKRQCRSRNELEIAMKMNELQILEQTLAEKKHLLLKQEEELQALRNEMLKNREKFIDEIQGYVENISNLEMLKK